MLESDSLLSHLCSSSNPFEEALRGNEKFVRHRKSVREGFKFEDPKQFNRNPGKIQLLQFEITHYNIISSHEGRNNVSMFMLCSSLMKRDCFWNTECIVLPSLAEYSFEGFSA